MSSVFNQNHCNVELIVADGGSSDGTVEQLQAWRARDPRVRWFSESDEGPADALNKAFKLARGTYFGWLNSDDLYTEGAIDRAISAFSRHPDWLMVYGQGHHIDESDSYLNTYPTRDSSTPLAAFRDGCFICQPTMFLKRTAWVLLGDLDVKLKTAFDFDYWVRAFLMFQDRIGFIDEVQACSRLHSDCITMKMRRYVAVEGMRLLAKHLGDAPGHWLLTYVNEMNRMPSNERGFDDFGKHIEETFNDVADYMNNEEREAIRSSLASMPCSQRTP